MVPYVNRQGAGFQGCREERSLLVVDPSVSVGRALTRLLVPYFAEVRVANDAEQAEAIAHGHLPTHVVCVAGVAGCASSWKLRWSLKRVVVLTGLVHRPVMGEGIDVVLEKPADPDLLVDSLLPRVSG